MQVTGSHETDGLPRQMHLNLFLSGEGHHEAAWRHPLASPAEAATARHYTWQAISAEQAFFESVFVADSLSAFIDLEHSPARDFEPITLLTAIAGVTSSVGLIGTMSTTFTEPYNLARQFASLDHISQGRAGWNIVTTAEERSARNFGSAPLPSHADRYARATEFVEVVRKLWDSREQGCILANQQTGTYADPRLIHAIEHTGPFFRVRGPLNIGRSPQGHPLLVQAGSSPNGRDFAARHAEVIFTVQHDLSAAQEFYRDIKARAASHGRDPRFVKVLPGIVVIVADTETAALARSQELDELIVPARALVALGERLGMDLTGMSLDESLPPLPPSGQFPGQQGRYQVIMRMARDKQLPLRQLIKRLGPGRGHRVIVGAAEQVADALQEWFTSGAADGFTVMPALLPADLQTFTDHVIPILNKRGLRAGGYLGRTLRSVLEGRIAWWPRTTDAEFAAALAGAISAELQALCPPRPRPSAQDASADFIAALATSVMGRDVAPGDDFFQAGATSLDLLRICAAVQSEYGVRVRGADIFDCPTPASLAAIIRQARSDQKGSSQ